MKIYDNIREIVKDDMVTTISKGSKVSIAAACFSMYAYKELKKHDENIPDEVVKTIAKRQLLRAVFRDASFANSPAKINVTEVFKLVAPDTRVKVI